MIKQDKDSDPIILSSDDWDSLIKDLEDPDPPNDYLQELFRIYLRVKHDDNFRSIV